MHVARTSSVWRRIDERRQASRVSCPVCGRLSTWDSLRPSDPKTRLGLGSGLGQAAHRAHSWEVLSLAPPGRVPEPVPRMDG